MIENREVIETHIEILRHTDRGTSLLLQKLLNEPDEAEAIIKDLIEALATLQENEQD